MKKRVIYVERKPSEYVSIEKAFREIAANLSGGIDTKLKKVYR